MAVLVLGFYVMPVTEAEMGDVFRWVSALAVLGALGLLVTRQLRRDSDRVGSLLASLVFVVCAVALLFYGIAHTTPGEFEGLVTRTDALYFTVVTLTTIGYGDIHPTGQFARLLVTLAIIFNLLFVAALVGAIADRLRRPPHRRTTEESA